MGVVTRGEVYAGREGGMDRVRMCAYGGGMKLSRCERQKHSGSKVQSFIGTQGPVAYGSSKACVRSGVVGVGAI